MHERYYEEIRKNELKLTQAEELELILKAQSGCTKSRDTIFYAHARYCLYEAKKRRMRNYDDELTQAANEGLLKAIYKFSPEYSNKFISYATFYIRSEINTWLSNNYRTIRLPSNLIHDIYRGDKDIEDFTSCTSIDILEPGLADNANSYIDSNLNDIDGKDYRINKILAFLPKKQREIILMRISEKELSWEEIAAHFGCTRENARAHYYKSIKRIKKKYTLEELKHFFF